MRKYKHLQFEICDWIEFLGIECTQIHKNKIPTFRRIYIEKRHNKF